ncbi:hypothetical protein FJZ31_37370 [Candidatus Poribacteria bacterium]|nr:hypothetical protein [Candidatus Poribacteria bacterium]
MTEIKVRDAYVRSNVDGQRWTIGTETVQMVFECKEGKFRLVSFQNKLFNPQQEYIDEKMATAPFSFEDEKQWVLVAGSAREVEAGGRPAAQLDLTLMRESLRVQFHVLAFPGTPILRQWVEFYNTGASPFVLKSPAPASILLRSDAATSYINYWMIGGHSQSNQGKMESASVTPSYHHKLNGTATLNYVPWMALHRNTGPKDGWFIALEYLGKWCLAVDHETPEPIKVSASIDELETRTLSPGERLELPMVTLGVFCDNLDNMAKWLYNWQYEYMWDYTHDDWYALMQFLTPWWANSHNLQEQFAGRLAYLDMDWSEYMRESGLEVLWDDAGWSADANIWAGNREGPDFAQTLRFFAKTGMKWALWFCGDPTSGIMDTKVGSWGNFQWRTDALGFNFAFDKAFRSEVTRFLKVHPRCSWHTCSGGSTYSHTFDIQRYGDVHYDTDLPGSDITNYYFSYLETPDKWFDMLATWGSYHPDTSRRMLSMTPKWTHYIKPHEMAQLRLIADLYHYLLQEGVAGRWSYITHPPIKGDTEHYYCQRVNYDRTKSLIIFKHRASGEVTIYPRGLLPEHRYLVEFDSTKVTMTRTGADLLANGIVIENQQPGELIYLNLPHRPGSGRDQGRPHPPGRVLTRRETNLWFCGVGIYWSPGSDDNWVSHYEIRRGSEILGKTCTGTYFFDRSEGWNPKAEYSVRTVDGDGNVSDWTYATPLADEPQIFSALGGHFSKSGREGWRAETTVDCRTFTPMVWVPPAKPSAADLGGTPNQPGGVEGYWEGTGAARVGRGWQQASTEVAGVRTWIAPQAGIVRIIGRVIKEYYHRNQGAPLRVRILHNDRKVWPDGDWAVAPVDDLTGVTHDLNLEVVTDDAIRFVLDKGSAPEHDLLAWMPRIVYTETETTEYDSTVMRILCGAEKPYIDHCGNIWSADRFYTGGKPISTKGNIEGASPTLSDQVLYQAGRAGEDFIYSIPVAPGLYSLRLKFAESEYQWCFARPFNLDINGRRVLRNFDVCQAARGSKRAYERVFRYLVPNADGQLVLRFTSGWEPLKKSGEAMVQAIEVVPEQKLIMRINVGSDTQFVDWNSFIWASDAHFKGGQVIKSDALVTQAAPTLYDQELYRTARTGPKLNYTMAVPPGLYTVHLKFAELWLSEPGKRPMNIAINGQCVWKYWDPATAAGQIGMAADIRVEDITPDKDGHITIKISAAGANDAILQGIEIE